MKYPAYLGILLLTAACAESKPILEENTPPTITSIGIYPEEAYTSTEVLCLATADDVNLDLVSISYLWSNEHGTELGVESGLLLTPEMVQPNERLLCTATASDGINDTIITDQVSISINNTLPVIESVSITPNSNIEVDTLLSCTAQASDADEEEPNYTYEWKHNGTTIGTDTELQLDSSSVAYEDSITCLVTVTDGYDGSVFEEMEIMIGNTPPTVSELSFSQPSYHTNDLIQVEAILSDPNATQTLSVQYEWHVVGTEGDNIAQSGSEETLDGTIFFNKNDNIYVIVTPNDGFIDGESQSSQSITIENTLPVIDSIIITPTSPTAETSTFSCVVTSSDADEEIPTHTYEWSLDGDILSFTTPDIVSVTHQYNQELTCTATPHDDSEAGLSESASTLITNTPPVVSAIQFDQSTYDTLDSITVSASLSDADQEQEASLSAIYEWHVVHDSVDSIVQTGSVNTLDGSYFVRADEVFVTITANDGITDGTSVSSSSTIIANSTPSDPSISLSPDPVRAEDEDLICTIEIESNDVDEEGISYTYTWFDADGTLQQTTESSVLFDTFPGADTTEGTWSCSVTAGDGITESATITTSLYLDTPCDTQLDSDCDGVYNGDLLPVIETGDFTYTYWPLNFRPTSNGGIYSEERHVRTGRFGFSYDVTQGSITQLGHWDVVEETWEGAEAENTDILAFDGASVTYKLQAGGSSYTATSFMSDQGSTTNPSQLIDMGRWMQQIEIPAVMYDETSFSGSTNLSVAPRHFVLTHHTQSTVQQNTETSVDIVLDGDFLLPLTEESWLVADRAVELTDAQGNGWIFIVPEDASCTLQRDSNGAIVAQKSVSSLASGTDIAISLLIVPAVHINQSQIDAYVYPDLSTRVAYAQLNTQGQEREARTYADWDDERGMYLVSLDSLAAMGWPSHVANWSNPDTHNWYNRHRIVLESTATEPVSIPIAFDGPVNTLGSITSGAGMIRDESGNPIGLPIQVSKNWHEAGYWPNWFHFYTAPVLAEASTHELELTLVNSKWGETYAASHAQLSLIGWGVNQQWDESALGAWGESITYDPDLTLNRAMVDDVRPFLVDANGEWSWTGNVGGADYLKYTDDSGSKHRLGRLRTQYTETGPNLTDVSYIGITDDGAISATIQTHLGRTDDMVRAYYRLSYTFLEDVSYDRMAFFQVAADKYGDNGFSQASYGDANSVLSERSIPSSGSKGYASSSDRGIPISGDAPWVYLYNSTKSGGNLPEDNADVGFVVRSFSATIGSTTITTPHINIYRTNNGWHQYSFELGLPYDANDTVIPAGSTVEATVEYLVVPNDLALYYGDSIHLLARSGFGTSDMMRQLADENQQTVTVGTGTLLYTHPIRIASTSGTIASQFSFEGGIGYSPITITGLPRHDGWVLEQETAPDVWSAIDQSVHENDFWQCMYDPQTATYSLTFNVENESPMEYRLRWNP